MVNFEYSLNTRVVFGPGRTADVGSIMANMKVRKPMLVLGCGKHAQRTGLLDKVLDCIKKEGMKYSIFNDVMPNPTLECVETGRKLFIAEECDFILSIGGGSVMDAGKAVALSLGMSDSYELWERCFLSYEPVSTNIKNGVVLTTSASGSETGESAVITKGRQKLIGSSPCAIPSFAILDPVNTLSLPSYQTACGLADILSHLQERYFIRATANDLSDKMLEAAMRNIIQSGEMLMKYPENIDLRSNVMWNATIAHNAILDRGRGGGDWACHMIEHEISARFAVAHGEGLSMITPSWLRFVSIKEECRQRLLQFASNVWGSDFPFDSTLGIEWAIEKQVDWYKRIGLRTSLSQLEGFSNQDAKDIASSFSYNPGQFVSLSGEDIYSILVEDLQ